MFATSASLISCIGMAGSLLSIVKQPEGYVVIESNVDDNTALVPC